ncbi:MAG: hypothetical protein RMJ37_02460 [Spirochaetia bacterium]|nr:hypothetical protein [Spirochaetota bacterium]MDW8112189.1 hypothetical protein [Spirochaetia bacterium]
MKKSFFVSLICVVFSTYTSGIQNQTISVIPEDSDSRFMAMLMETKLANSGKLNIYYHIGKIGDDNEKMKFMSDNKLSGLLAISNKTLRIFTTKGLLTNISLSDDKVEAIVSNILEIFPPKEPEKILKEIVEIDYVSPLEETRTKHSIAVHINPTQPIIRLEKESLGTNINMGQTNIFPITEDFEQKPEYSIRYMIGLSYGLDTRYFSLSLGLSIEPKPSPNFCIDLSSGFWFFKGFMMIGLGMLYEHSVFEIRGFTKHNNETLNLQSDLERISFDNLYLFPVVKLKFSKNEALSFIPLLVLSGNVGGENVVIDSSAAEPGNVRFLGIMISFETSFIDNISLGFQIKALTLSLGTTGYLLDGSNIVFVYSASISESVFLRYKF